MDSGKDLLTVEESPITIEIAEETILFAIGSNKKSGIYTVMFEADKYFLLDCKINGQLANERVVVFKKGKKITHVGIYLGDGIFIHSSSSKGVIVQDLDSFGKSPEYAGIKSHL